MHENFFTDSSIAPSFLDLIVHRSDLLVLVFILPSFINYLLYFGPLGTMYNSIRGMVMEITELIFFSIMSGLCLIVAS